MLQQPFPCWLKLGVVEAMFSLLGPAGKVQQSLCCGLPSRSSDWHVLFRWRERLSSERWPAGSRFWPVVAGSCPSRAANAGADHGGVVPGAQQVDERLWTPTRTAQAGASRATSPGVGPSSTCSAVTGLAPPMPPQPVPAAGVQERSCSGQAPPTTRL